MIESSLVVVLAVLPAEMIQEESLSRTPLVDDSRSNQHFRKHITCDASILVRHSQFLVAIGLLVRLPLL